MPRKSRIGSCDPRSVLRSVSGAWGKRSLGATPGRSCVAGTYVLDRGDGGQAWPQAVDKHLKLDNWEYSLASMNAESNTVVESQISRGEKIVSAATFVGDRDDLDLWRRKRVTWANNVINALRDQIDTASLRGFERAASQPVTMGNVHEDLPVEVGRLREAIGILRSLAGSHIP
jgi:hypothetical protein